MELHNRMLFYNPAWLIGAVFLLWLLGYQSTWLGMVSIWERSETFAHGYLILPISIFLLWRNRQSWQQLRPQQDPWALLPLLVCGSLWFIAAAVDVLVVKQLMAVFILQAAIWLLVGREIVAKILFPLMYLLFAVPMGEALIAPMTEMTARFVILAVKATGIPIYYEGTFFSLPTGNWSVVEGCSGVRYLIASLALGCLYAYLTYQKTSKRLLFVFLSALVPIVANWLRAFGIVMLGHASGMKLATGVDHLVYGWVFFGLVIFLMFTIGHIWRDPEPQQAVSEETNKDGFYGRLSLGGSLLTVVSLLLWPTAAHTVSHFSEHSKWELITPQAQNWTPTALASTNWQPRYIQPDQRLQQEYVSGAVKVGAFLMLYQQQGQGRELFSSANQLIAQKHPIWREIRQPDRRPLQNFPLEIEESTLKSARTDLLVWHWKDINGRKVTTLYEGKLWEAWYRVSGRSFAGTGVVLYTPIDGQLEPARERLTQFVREWHRKDPDFTVAIKKG